MNSIYKIPVLRDASVKLLFKMVELMSSPHYHLLASYSGQPQLPSTLATMSFTQVLHLLAMSHKSPCQRKCFK